MLQLSCAVSDNIGHCVPRLLQIVTAGCIHFFPLTLSYFLLSFLSVYFFKSMFLMFPDRSVSANQEVIGLLSVSPTDASGLSP